MRGDAAGDEIEAAIGERQGLGIGQRRLHVGQALFVRELLRLHQHLGRQVAGDDAGHMRGELSGGVSGAGGDVERDPGLARGDQLDEAGEARALGVHGGGQVGRRIGAELLLYEFFRHGGCLVVYD